MIFQIQFRLDDELNNDETTNVEIVEILKKELDTMIPTFEEHLRKKYPAYVTFHFVNSVHSHSFSEPIIPYEQYIITKWIWHIHQQSTGLRNRLVRWVGLWIHSLKICNGKLLFVTYSRMNESFRFHPSGELMVKRENDPWIIAKRSDMRELLIAVNQRNANLKEISGKLFHWWIHTVRNHEHPLHCI